MSVADRRDSPLLSVSQFAAREGVTRARVLQLLAARRVAGARRIGHHWAIPTAAAIERRPPGARPDLVITQTMELGDFDDQRRLEASLGHDGLAQALRGAAAGRLSPRSWAYWHYRLGLAKPGRVPPLPRRRLD